LARAEAFAGTLTAVRILVAPDSFGGTLSAPQAADAIARGWQFGAAGDEVTTLPLSDGGPGFVDVLVEALPARCHPLDVRGPLGQPVAAVLLLDGSTAYVESAQACGLHLVPPGQRNPDQLTTYGVGELINAALDLGAHIIVVGLGGSATNDGGAGALSALGLRLLDATGSELPATVRGLGRLHRVDPTGLDPRLALVDLVAASDVDNPLLGPAGASAVYGPQKGAGPTDVADFDASLAYYADILGRDLPGAAGLAEAPGAGAAGGLGFGLLVAGGRRVAGIATVLAVLRLAERVAAADLVVTGEGSFDGQSLRGKVVAGVAAAAAQAGVACLVLAGQVQLGPEDLVGSGVTAAYSLADSAGSVQAAMARPAEELTALAARVAAETLRR
jgi:glycerate kinase